MAAFELRDGRWVSADGSYWWDGSDWRVLDSRPARPAELLRALVHGIAVVVAPPVLFLVIGSLVAAGSRDATFDRPFFDLIAWTLPSYVVAGLGALSVPLFAWRHPARSRIRTFHQELTVGADWLLLVGVTSAIPWAFVGFLIGLGGPDLCRNDRSECAAADSMGTLVGLAFVAALLLHLGRRHPSPPSTSAPLPLDSFGRSSHESHPPDRRASPGLGPGLTVLIVIVGSLIAISVGNALLGRIFLR